MSVVINVFYTDYAIGYDCVEWFECWEARLASDCNGGYVSACVVAQVGINTPSHRSVGRERSEAIGFRSVQVKWAHAAMMLAGMMLGVIVGFVGTADLPSNLETVLADLVTDPEKTHVHCFGSFLFDAVVRDANRGFVVGDKWGCILWMSEFFKGVSFGYGVLAIDK